MKKCMLYRRYVLTGSTTYLVRSIAYTNDATDDEAARQRRRRCDSAAISLELSSHVPRLDVPGKNLQPTPKVMKATVG